jgi:hypothetical protein
LFDTPELRFFVAAKLAVANTKAKNENTNTKKNYIKNKKKKLRGKI